jgi:hypothetical protein
MSDLTPEKCSNVRPDTSGENKDGDPKAAVFLRCEPAYFTPCISFWIFGASSSRSPPPIISDQKPKV